MDKEMIETNPASTGKKSMKFPKGSRGRPKGSPNQTARLVKEIFVSEFENIVRAIIKAAVEDGNELAMRMCVERLLPLKHDNLIEIGLPIDTVAGVLEDIKMMAEAMANGERMPLEVQ